MNSARGRPSVRTRRKSFPAWIITTLVFAVLAVEANATGIINGDFEAGNTGFGSDYTEHCDGTLGAGYYCIDTNPAGHHNRAASYRDHTSGQGQMMIVNGAETQGVVWRETVSVTPHTTYKFSVWISSWTESHPALIRFLFNGLGYPSRGAPSTTRVWSKYEQYWDSSNCTTVEIEIENMETSWTGNDFALDDIGFAIYTGSVIRPIAPPNLEIVRGYELPDHYPEVLADLNSPPPSFETPPWLPVHSHQDLHQWATFMCPSPVGLTLTEGACVSIPAPACVDLDSLESNSEIRVFGERQGIVLGGDLPVDFFASGAYYEYPELPGEASVSRGTVVSSYLLHFDPVGGGGGWDLSGTVGFDSEILGVCILSDALAESDSIVGLPSIQYPPDARRAVTLGDLLTWFELAPDRRSLTVSLHVEDGLDQVRVITMAGTTDPLAMPYVRANEYLDGADEFTLDNCSSAFYRFTFELPSFREPVLFGAANVDDIGVVYLNGNRISPQLLITDGFGFDRADSLGASLLAAPTADFFGSQEASYFRTGENELVFGVCGDASPGGSTGLEFVAAVAYDSLSMTAVNEPERTGKPRFLNVPKPNPANGFLSVSLELPVSSQARVRVFDLAGRVVATLLDEVVAAGVRELKWGLRGSDGHALASGTYRLRLEAMGCVETRTVVVVK